MNIEVMIKKKRNAQRESKINLHLYDTKINLYKKDRAETKRGIKEVEPENPCILLEMPEALDLVMREFPGKA